MGVFFTGRRIFDGAWIALYLKTLGYNFHGFSLSQAKNSLFDLDIFERLCDARTVVGVRNKKLRTNCMMTVKPCIVIHFAAQTLVLESQKNREILC